MRGPMAMGEPAARRPSAAISMDWVIPTPGSWDASILFPYGRKPDFMFTSYLGTTGDHQRDKINEDVLITESEDSEDSEDVC